MPAIFDHLTAVVAGAALIVALLVLQTRDRTAAVQGTVHGASRSQASSVLDVLAQDLDNTMSEPQARDRTGDYRARLVRSADGERTDLVEVPAFVRTAAGAPYQPAHVRYTLVPEGDSVRVGGRNRARHALLREVDLGAGYGAAQEVARNLTDLDVTFVGRVSERDDGAPPLRFTGIDLSLALALPSVGDGARPDASNLVVAAETVRPPNLTAGT